MPLKTSLLALLPPSQSHNLHTLRHSPLTELSGSLGDLGTLLPLLLALTLSHSISLPSTLIFTGLANLLTGAYFRLPLPVQPMKAIAAVAITNSFSVTETTSAGIFVGAVVFVAAVSGALGAIGRAVPVPVVKGIQVGAGLTLCMSGGTMIAATGWWGGDSRVVAVLAFLALMLLSRPQPMRGAPSAIASGSQTPTRRRTAVPVPVPFALIITTIGITTGIIISARSTDGLPSFFALWRPRIYIPSALDFRTGILSAGLGQLPLTVLNSVVAVTYLSAELLPSPPYPPAPSFSALGASVGAINLIAAWFGAMPVCHGSGGLAGQVKFGARSGTSVMLLGLLKLGLGLLVSEEWVRGVLGAFPRSLLGVMVIGAGLELARVGEGLNDGAGDLWVDAGADGEDGDGGARGHDDGGGKVKRELSDMQKTERWYVMMVTVALLLAFKNDGVGFVGGLLTHAAMKSPEYWEKWRERRVSSRDERTRLLQD